MKNANNTAFNTTTMPSPTNNKLKTSKFATLYSKSRPQSSTRGFHRRVKTLATNPDIDISSSIQAPKVLIHSGVSSLERIFESDHINQRDSAMDHQQIRTVPSTMCNMDLHLIRNINIPSGENTALHSPNNLSINLAVGSPADSSPFDSGMITPVNMAALATKQNFTQ